MKCYCPVIGPNFGANFFTLVTNRTRIRVLQTAAAAAAVARLVRGTEHLLAISAAAQGCSRELEVNCTASDLFLLVYCSALLLAAIDFKVPESYL